MAARSKGGRARLVLTWSVEIGEGAAPARQKPLALLGHALAAPHADSLAAALREREQAETREYDYDILRSIHKEIQQERAKEAMKRTQILVA